MPKGRALQKAQEWGAWIELGDGHILVSSPLHGRGFEFAVISQTGRTKAHVVAEDDDAAKVRFLLREPLG